MGLRYTFANGPMQTTAAFAKVATGTAIKTMLQFKPIIPCKIIEWGCSFDAFAAALPGEVELIETGTVNATVTAAVAADLSQDSPEAVNLNSLTNLVTLGTAATGYTASAEGSITSVRNLAGPLLLPPTNPFMEQYPLGREPYCIAGNVTRIRMTFGTTVNAYCYIKVEF